MLFATLLAFQLAKHAPIQVIEVPRPSAQGIAIEAYIKAPEPFNEREEAAWQLLEIALLKGTTEFSGEQLMFYGSQGGSLPRCQAMPDWMRIRMTAPADDVELAGTLIESVLTHADLGDDALQRIRPGLEATTKEPWLHALRPSQPRFSALRNRDVRELYARVFRPENIRLVASGAFQPGEAQKALTDRFATWDPKKVTRSAWTDTRQVSTRPGPITSFEFTGPILKPAEGTTPARILAVLALGVGKESAMYKVLRTDLRLSYRQDALLWPTSKGWQPRLIMLKTFQPDDLELAAKIRDALTKNIETWAQPQLERALALADSSLMRGLPYSPFWLSAYGPELRDPDFAATWAGYNALIAGPWSTPEILLLSLTNVTVDELKAQALALLEQSNVQLIRGTP